MHNSGVLVKYIKSNIFVDVTLSLFKQQLANSKIKTKCTIYDLFQEKVAIT